MSEIRTLPVLPLRDIVVFPHMVVPLFVGRDKSVRALEEVMRGDKQILLVTQTMRLSRPVRPPGTGRLVAIYVDLLQQGSRRQDTQRRRAAAHR